LSLDIPADVEFDVVKVLSNICYRSTARNGGIFHYSFCVIVEYYWRYNLSFLRAALARKTSSFDVEKEQHRVAVEVFASCFLMSPGFPPTNVVGAKNVPNDCPAQM